MGEQRLAVGILLLDQFRLTSFACLSDGLRSVAGPTDRIETMTPTGKPAVAACGTELHITVSPPWPDVFDHIVVLGRLTGPLWQCSGTIGRYLRTADRLEVTLVGLESGIDALARLGFLNGYRACASAQDLVQLSKSHPKVDFRSGRLMVEDGRRLTALGGTASADLAALLIDRSLGPQAVHLAMADLVRDGARPSDASPPIPTYGTSGLHPIVRQAIDIMLRETSDPIAIDRLSEILRISRRQLDRLFVKDTGDTAKAVFMRIRLKEAISLLQSRRTGLNEVAWATGFVDAPHLSRSLRRHTGLGLEELRQAGRARVI